MGEQRGRLLRHHGCERGVSKGRVLRLWWRQHRKKVVSAPLVCFPISLVSYTTKGPHSLFNNSPETYVKCGGRICAETFARGQCFNLATHEQVSSMHWTNSSARSHVTLDPGGVLLSGGPHGPQGRTSLIINMHTHLHTINN